MPKSVDKAAEKEKETRSMMSQLVRDADYFDVSVSVMGLRQHLIRVATQA